MNTIHCKYDELLDPKSLKDHPKNRNKHGSDQIERLASMYKFHGIRHPIIVSELSGFIVAGHGRKLAAIRAGIKEFPVVFQSFESSEAEYAFIQSDNAIALWADLDLKGINEDLGDLGPDFDLDMLGIKDFTLDVAEKDEEVTGDIEIAKELDEKNDYIVIFFDNKEKFMKACDLFDLKKVQINNSATKHDAFETTGLGRVVNGEKILAKLGVE